MTSGVSIFSGLPLSISTNDVIWGMVVLALLIFVIISAVLLYHWQRYKITSKVPHALITVYFSVSIILLIILSVSALSYLDFFHTFL
jgi:membrane-associated HD superfamily phosphohydrolase